MNKLALWTGMIVLVLMPGSVFASLAGYDTFFTYTPEIGGGTVTVHSWVDDLAPTASGYRYNYQISNPSINIQWFSAELLADAIITSWPTYSMGPGEPALWLENGLGTSFDATFINPLTPSAGSSVVLWFTSSQAPTTLNGMVAGITGGKYNAFYGDLYSPIPEPATMVLLVLGAGCVLRRKRN